MDGPDRRGAPRFPLYVQIDYLDARQGVRDFTENLSASGLFIRTDRRFEIGERVPLVLSFPSLLDPLTLTVEVVRLQQAQGADRPAGIGVRVPDEMKEDQQRLLAFARAVDGSQASGTRLRDFVVLVVEDNALLAQMYGDTLRTLLAEVRLLVEFAGHGEQALQRLERKPVVDLVFTDLMMPVMDGFAFVQRLREDAATRHIPVVVMSSAGPADETRALRLGANAFLRKPLRLPDLLSTVKSLIHLKS